MYASKKTKILKAMMTVQGLSYRKLAIEAGLSLTTVIKLCQGNILDPKTSTINSLCKALQCTPQQLGYFLDCKAAI